MANKELEKVDLVVKINSGLYQVLAGRSGFVTDDPKKLEESIQGYCGILSPGYNLKITKEARDKLGNNSKGLYELIIKHNLNVKIRSNLN